MNKKKVIVISFTVVILAASVYFLKYSYNYFNPGENGSFKLKVGEEFYIKLHENPSTGYSNCWLNKDSSNCIEKMNEDYEEGLNSKFGYIGTGGYLKITFKATKKGRDTLRIGSCPSDREGKTCEDYNTANSSIDNEFYVFVE